MQITIDASDVTKNLSKDIRRFNRKFLPVAEQRALLRVSRTALSRWVSASARAARVKVGLIRKRSNNRPIRGGGRRVSINAEKMPAVILGPKGRIPKQTRNGIRIAGRQYKKGFIATAKLGKRPSQQSIFERAGDKRGPLREARVEIHPFVAGNIGEARKAFDDRIDKELTQQLNRLVEVNRR